MKISDTLIEALNIIDVPGQWTKGRMARTTDGTQTDPCGTTATCFCSAGAVYRNTGLNYDDYRPVFDYLTETAEQLVPDYQLGQLHAQLQLKNAIVHVNDNSESQFDERMGQMWLGAIFNALADGK